MIQELCLLLPSSSSRSLLRSLLISSMLLCIAEHKGIKLIMLRSSTVAGLPQALRGKWQQLDFQLKMEICSSCLESTESPEKLISARQKSEKRNCQRRIVPNSKEKPREVAFNFFFFFNKRKMSIEKLGYSVVSCHWL